LALCAEIEGLFVDLPPRPRERFTLVGCTPDGALGDLLDRLPAEALGTERAWLGDISVLAPPPPPSTPPWWGEDLSAVSRKTIAMAELVGFHHDMARQLDERDQQ
jgi:hypothetical protein